jgi:hypothetical protein
LQVYQTLTIRTNVLYTDPVVISNADTNCRFLLGNSAICVVCLKSYGLVLTLILQRLTNMNTTSTFPNDLRFIPIQGIKSFRAGTGTGGAWRLFVLAKNLDTTGRGHVSRELVRAFALSLGINSKTFDRWLNSARVSGFVSDIQRKTGEWDLLLISHEKVVSILDHNKNIRPIYISLPACLLISKGWKSYVFAAWQAQFTNNGERLVSQKKQFEITGVSEQLQRQYNREAGVTSKKNYAISNIHANGFHGVLEFGSRAGLFKYWNEKTHQLYLGWRIPNTRIFSLLRTSGSHKTRRALSLFNKTVEQYSNSMKALRKQQTNTFSELYVFYRNSKSGNGLWTHLPLK